METVVYILSVIGFVGVLDVMVFRGRMGVWASTLMPWNWGK